MDPLFVDGAGGRVAYWVDGQGECVVLTHGATMDHGLFAPQTQELSTWYKVITWDVPAHGLSRPYDGFTLNGAADILISILDAEDVAGAHLVGQSMGGYISQIAAMEHPDRVKSITTVGSTPLKPSSFSKLDRALLKLTPMLLRLYPYDYLVKAIAHQVADSDGARSYALDTLTAFTKGEIASISSQVYSDAIANSTESALPVPAFVTFGENDRTGKVAEYSRRWAEMDGHPLYVVPDAAHNANMDNPADFNKALHTFLQSHTRGRAPGD